MELTKEQKEELRKDPIANLFAGLLGTSLEALMQDVEKEQSRTKRVAEVKPEPIREEKDEVGDRIKSFFDKLVEDGKATVATENGHPHYSIKLGDEYKESESQETLVEENEGVSFTMSKEELAEFVRDYTKLENTFRKLEYAFGVDLNANADSIYSQYNGLVWNLIGKIFGEDNRDDIADYCFGNSNFDTVEDLYEELI